MINKISLKIIHALSLCPKYNIRCIERFNRSIDFGNSAALSPSLALSFSVSLYFYLLSLSLSECESHKIGHQYNFNNIYVYIHFDELTGQQHIKREMKFFACHQNIKEFRGIDFTIEHCQTNVKRAQQQMMRERQRIYTKRRRANEFH